jgi:hypothetical protein
LRAIYCTTALPTSLRAVYCTTALLTSLRAIYKTTDSIAVVSTSDHRPHLVHPFGTRTYHPKALRPCWLTEDVRQAIERRMMGTSKGNLKERIPGKAPIRLNRQPHLL